MASVLYVVNNTTQLVPTDGTINLGSIVRRTCNSQATLSGNGVSLTGNGYYVVEVTATFTAPVTGDITVQLMKDDEPVRGAIATETISTATTETRSISFSCEVRNICCCEMYSVLTLVNTGDGATFSNVAVRVKRDA